MRNKYIALLFVLAASLAANSYADEMEAMEWDDSLEEATVCASDTAECRKVSCIEQCIQTGEDPMECPSYCILEAKAPMSLRVVAKQSNNFKK